MSIYTEEQAREICEKVVKLSKADECVVNFNGGTAGNIRYALNEVSTSGIVNDANLAVQVAYGKRVGIATTNVFDDAALVAVVRRAEELAKLAPENPEFMPAIEKQKYTATKTLIEATANVTPEYRAQVALDSIAPCREQNLVAAGFFTDNNNYEADAAALEEIEPTLASATFVGGTPTETATGYLITIEGSNEDQTFSVENDGGQMVFECTEAGEGGCPGSGGGVGVWDGSDAPAAPPAGE